MSESDAELIFNLWAIYDGSTGVVYALSGRAYNMTGTDREKLNFLKLAAQTDHVLAKRYRLPKRFGIVYQDGQEQEGVTYLNAVYDPGAQLFEGVFKQLESEMPPQPRLMDDQIIGIPQKIPHDPLCVTTVLYEDEAGNIRPIVTDEDRAWVVQQERRLHGY